MPKKPLAVSAAAVTIGEVAAIVLVITVAKSAIAEPYYVPSGSMEPTLLIGDELLATKFPYGYSSASLPLAVAVAAQRSAFSAHCRSAATSWCFAIPATARRSG